MTGQLRWRRQVASVLRPAKDAGLRMTVLNLGTRPSLPGDEGGERGGFTEVDAERAFFADMGEGDFERILNLVYLVGLHGCAGYVLSFVVGGAGGYVLIDYQGPLILGWDGVDAVGTDGDGSASEAELGFGEESHGRAARGPGFAVGNFVALGGDGIVADVDLASVVEIAAGGGGIVGLLGRANGSEQKENGDDQVSAEHGKPLWPRSVAPKRVEGKGIRNKVRSGQGSVKPD